MKAHTHKGHGEAIQLHTGDLHGRAVLITRAAGAARCLADFAGRAASSFVQRYEAEGEARLVNACQRYEIEGIFHAAAAAAFAGCRILPASRAVLYGYGCAARPAGVSSVECCRVGARGLLPFVAMLAWRRALRRAANVARSFLCGRSGGGLVSGSPRRGCVVLSGVVHEVECGDGEYLAGAEDEAGNCGLVPSGDDGRGVGDGGAITRGAGLWARGNADGAADAWARSLAHSRECLRAYWLCGSKTGGHGASLRWRDGLAADEARMGALVETLRGDGLATWAGVGLALGDGSRVAGATGEAVRRLRKRADRGDQLLTEHPQRCADALRAAGFVESDASTLPLPAVRGGCVCHVCARVSDLRADAVGVRAVRQARAAMLGEIVGDLAAWPSARLTAGHEDGGGVNLAALPVADVCADAPQAVRWWQTHTRADRARVCALLGESMPVAAVPAVRAAGPWDALRAFAPAPAPAVESLPLPLPLSAAAARRTVHAAGRAVRLAARKLAAARVVLGRAADAAAARSERWSKAAAAVVRLAARMASAPKSKAARAARSYWGARVQAAKARKVALAACPVVLALRVRRDVCAARLAAAESAVDRAAAAASKAAKLRKLRVLALPVVLDLRARRDACAARLAAAESALDRAAAAASKAVERRARAAFLGRHLAVSALDDIGERRAALAACEGGAVATAAASGARVAFARMWAAAHSPRPALLALPS
jgi:hypothetical protein